MIALIDCDLICWEIGSAIHSEREEPLTEEECIDKVKGRINSILYATQAGSWKGYITSDDKSNFRYSVATILPYKGNRAGVVKPDNYYFVRSWLLRSPHVREVFGYEADDAMSMEQCGYPEGHTIICSRDKDLNMVPGWHYSWSSGGQKEKPVYFISEEDGLRNFYCQLMTGDNTDNILGLYGVGPASQTLKFVRTADLLDVYEYVKDHYKKRFGSYWQQFLDENAKLLWMLRSEDDLENYGLQQSEKRN